MSAATEHPVCPHDRDTFVKEEAVYSYRCPECKGRVCLDCRRYGNKGFMLPLVSWMTGVCDGCYSERGQRDRIRKAYWANRKGRERLAKVWGEGFDAGHQTARAVNPEYPDAPANPYAEPSAYEQSVLEHHDWLRDEVSS